MHAVGTPSNEAAARPPLAPTPSARPRSTAIDLLKACSIIAVIWIHAFQQLFWTEAVFFQRVALLTRFAVPAFFFASGYLYGRAGPLPVRRFVTDRLMRLLVPYVVASILA